MPLPHDIALIVFGFGLGFIAGGLVWGAWRT